MGNQNRIVIYVDPGLRAAIDEAADKARDNRSEWIREAIEERLYREKLRIAGKGGSDTE